MFFSWKPNSESLSQFSEFEETRGGIAEEIVEEYVVKAIC